jgi:hypothetical protein
MIVERLRVGSVGTALVLLLASVGAAGCGGGSGTTVIENRTVTQTVPDTSTSRSGPEGCPDVADIGPTGSDPADAVDVQAINADCATASGLARDFYPASIRTGAPAGGTVPVNGFGCRERQVTTVVRVTCVRAASEVTFALGAPGGSSPTPITPAGAEDAARRAASGKVEDFGITIPPASWQADCRRAGDAYACGVASTGGQCSGSVVVRSDGTVPTSGQRVGCRE